MKGFANRASYRRGDHSDYRGDRYSQPAAVKMAANQASLRTLNTREVTYSCTYNQGFASTLAQLGPPASGHTTSSNAGLVDSVLSGGSKSGYSFVYAASAVVNRSTPNYTLNANPISVGATGKNYYFTDATNMIRQNPSAQASVSGSSIAASVISV